MAFALNSRHGPTIPARAWLEKDKHAVKTEKPASAWLDAKWKPVLRRKTPFYPKGAAPVRST
jgi:hypothetical protein